MLASLAAIHERAPIAGHAHAHGLASLLPAAHPRFVSQALQVQDVEDDLDEEALASAPTHVLPDDAAVEHLDSASESDYSDVGTPADARERASKGSELRVVAKVEELGGVTTLRMPKEAGSVRASHYGRMPLGLPDEALGV